MTLTLSRWRPDRGRERRTGSGVDAVTWLSLFVVTLIAIQSRLVISVLGGVGQPAQVVALAALVWWIYHQVQRPVAGSARAEPVRVALLGVLTTFAVSFVVAMMRPISGAEGSVANIGIVTLMGWSGVLLLANDGIPSVRRFEQLVQRIVLAGSLLAVLAIAQFATHQDLIRDLVLPGLSENASQGDLLQRSGFSRPAGTALHPIELGAVLTMILPLAITRARLDSSASRVLAWLGPTVIALATVLTSSRSALLSALVVIVVLGLAWSNVERLLALMALFLGLAAVAVLIPSFLGSLFKLFSRAADDPSVESRTQSYALVGQLFSHGRLFGRGFRTLMPSYRILDNQYLTLLLEVGLVGLTAVIVLFVTAMACAARVRRVSANRALREYGQALVASVAGAVVGLATYDGLTFPMAAALLFLILGLCGAAWRLARTAPAPEQLPAGSG